MNRRLFLQSGMAAGLTLSLPGMARATTAAGGDEADLVRRLLETLHPGLYRYLSPRQFSAAHRDFAAQWHANTALDARYLALSRLLGQIRCGHSYANFFNQSDAVVTALFDRPTRLPFAFRWLGDAMVVIQNQSGANGRTPVDLPAGTLIRAIDGVPVRTLYRRLRPYARVDGHNEGKARALLSVTGGERFEFFDIFHGLLFGAPAAGHFTLDCRLPGATRDSRLSAPALTLAERRAFLSPETADPDAARWQWTQRPDGVAVLTMDGWDLYNSRWDWQAWLHDRLDSLTGAGGLVIDLRRNEGGLDCGDPILARLIDRPLPQATGRRLVRYRRVPDDLRPVLDTWDPGFFDWGDDAAPHDERYFALASRNGYEPLQPDGRRITVPVAVLTSAQNSSATFQFADRMQRNRLGLLVGETTGGNRRGINGGAFFFARLPQSGIEFDIPLIGYFPDGRPADAGITPDIATVPTAADIATGYDRPLATAISSLLRR